MLERFFFKHVGKEAGRLAPDLFFLKALYGVKQLIKTLVLVYFGSPRLGVH